MDRYNASREIEEGYFIYASRKLGVVGMLDSKRGHCPSNARIDILESPLSYHDMVGKYRHPFLESQMRPDLAACEAGRVNFMLLACSCSGEWYTRRHGSRERGKRNTAIA